MGTNLNLVGLNKSNEVVNFEYNRNVCARNYDLYEMLINFRGYNTVPRLTDIDEERSEEYLAFSKPITSQMLERFEEEYGNLIEECSTVRVFTEAWRKLSFEEKYDASSDEYQEDINQWELIKEGVKNGERQGLKVMFLFDS